MRGQTELLRSHVKEKLFWAKVCLHTVEGCWVWLGAKSRSGYGRFNVAGKNRFASRVSWLLHYGADPGGMHVCHHCDNPPCVNPKHLFLGDDADNSIDKCAKGRQHRPGVVGEDSYNHKLSGETVLQIRELIEDGISQKEVAKRFGISQTNVSAIKRRKTWGHI